VLAPQQDLQVASIVGLAQKNDGICKLKSEA
jgi:hypothetical protein